MLYNIKEKQLQIHDYQPTFRRPGIIGAGAMNNHFHYEDDSDEDETEEEAQTSISQQAPGFQGSKQG